MKNVLALDLASATGWARSPALEHGSATFTGSRPDKLCRLSKWLSNAIAEWDIDTVVFERPIVRGGPATRMAWGMAGVTEAIATASGCAVLDVGISTAKKFWVGDGKADKDAMIAEAWARGYDPSNDHEADALAILFYFLQTAENDNG